MKFDLKDQAKHALLFWRKALGICKSTTIILFHSLFCHKCDDINTISKIFLTFFFQIPNVPTAVIAGPRKVGTGFIKILLESHPQVYIPKGEMHFFDRDEVYQKGTVWIPMHGCIAAACREKPCICGGITVRQQQICVLNQVRL